MIDEDDFQRALDANPSNAAIRGVFADWLFEQGDERWLGMRWLFLTGKRPTDDRYEAREGRPWGWYWGLVFDGRQNCACIDEIEHHNDIKFTDPIAIGNCWAWPTRQEAETSLCNLFAALSAETRDRLLAEAEAEHEKREGVTSWAG